MEDLAKAYREKRLILFIGAGVSKGLGLPSWTQLIDNMAVELGYDPDIFRTYGNARTLAEFYRLEKGGHFGSFRSAMDREWHSTAIDVSQSQVHELIAKANFELIYTTNYDRWIERAFEYWQRPYSKIVSVDDVPKITPNSTQIVKFHGDFDDDTSLVLDETSYFERMQFESPLDIKFRSDVLGRSVLFIGYGLGDINIRLLFYKLAHLWKASSRATPPTSFFFSPRPNPVQERTLAQWNIKMISTGNDDPTESLITFLKQLSAGSA